MWSPSNFALPVLCESTEAPIRTDFEVSIVVCIPQTRHHVLIVNANWFSTYMTAKVKNIHDCYMAELNTYTGTISMLGNASICVDDGSSGAGDDDTIDSQTIH